MNNQRIRKIELSLNSCFNVFDKSFRQAELFSCITDNLGTSSLPKKWEIQSDVLKYSPRNIPQNKEDQEDLLNDFHHFVSSYLVRNCIESFALALENLFMYLLLNGKEIPSNHTLIGALSEKEKKLRKQFNRLGLYNGEKNSKIQMLNKKFELSLQKKHQDVLHSLKDIRNCYAHHAGIVRKTDGKEEDKNKRKFSWTTLKVVLVNKKSGKITPVKLNETVEQESYFGLQTQRKCKSFSIGESFHFDSSEVYEIAFSLKQIGTHYLKQLEQPGNANI